MPPGSASVRGPGASSAVALDPADACTAFLRRELLSTIGRRRPLTLPWPVLATAHQTATVRGYLAWWATHPNPQGAFAARTRWLRLLPGGWLVKTMFAFGYDGLIYLDGGAVAGHVFFQRRGSELHGFSTAVSPPFDHGGYSVVMLLDYVTYASRCPGIARARVGRGQNNVTQRFLRRLQAHEAVLGWTVDLDGWIHFRPRPA